MHSGDRGPGEFKGLISLLGFYSKTGNLGLIDRIGLALSPEQVIDAVYDAMRAMKALKSRQIVVVIKYKTSKGEEKEALFKCCEYSEDIDEYPEGVKGVVTKVIEGDASLVNKNISCVSCPLIPSEDELNNFYKLIREKPNEGLRLAKEIATIALAGRYPGGGE